MNKIFLALICLYPSLMVSAQPSSPSLQDGPHVGRAINIAVYDQDGIGADNYFADAEKNERMGDLNGALSLFGKAAFEYNSDKKLNKYASTLLRMSNVHFMLSHYVEAEQVILNVALKTYSRLGSKAGQLASYNQLGKIYLASNKLTQSLWFYTQQGILAQQLRDHTAYIDSVLGIVAVKIKKKEYSLATKDLNRAEQLAKNANISQFNYQIKMNKQAIASQQLKKSKG